MEKEKFDKDRFYEFSDKTQAFDYCKKCVEDDENDVNALLILGECYYLGVGTEVDRKEARKIFKRVIKLDRTNKVAKKYLWERIKTIFLVVVAVLIVLYGITSEIKSNPKYEDLKFYQELQEKVETNPNDSASWYKLGMLYYSGQEYDEEKAFECYKKANELDNTNTLYWMHIGYCYKNGVGTEIDDQKAFECYKKVTELDSTSVSYWEILAFCYKNGIGTEIDEKKAFECYKKLTELDSTSVLYWEILGFCYQDGIGTEIDEKKALECYKKVSELNNNITWNKLEDEALMELFNEWEKNFLELDK